MKKKRIAAALISAAIVTVSSCQMFATCASAEGNGVLVIGDSLAAGEGLADGEINYTQMIAEALDETPVFETRSSYSTDDILNLVKNDATVQAEIAENDIIIVSAGNDDILSPVLEGIANEGYKTLDEAAAKVSPSTEPVSSIYAALTKKSLAVGDNIQSICNKIKDINPGAQVVVQNIYNPLYVSDDRLTLRISAIYTNLDADVLNTINKYVKSTTGVTVVDMYSAFAKNAETLTKCEKLSAYPTKSGNIVMASEILSSIDAPYKSESMARMYTTMDAASRKAFVKNCNAEAVKADKYFSVEIGDSNSDNKIDSKDAVNILKAYAQQLANQETTIDVANEDLNFDGKLSSADAVIVLKYYAASLTGAENSLVAYLGKN